MVRKWCCGLCIHNDTVVENAEQSARSKPGLFRLCNDGHHVPPDGNLLLLRNMGPR